MRAALEVYLKEKPDIKAIWIGTRRVDPNGGLLTHFDYTDKDWPQFMRIHPVIVSLWFIFDGNIRANGFVFSLSSGLALCRDLGCK
jgi:hypothetical protein